jgi:nucleotide-binding universal stress UspA family protein
VYANIVIGVDGKDGGRDAIALAPLLARDTAEIAVLHVCPAESRQIAEADRELLGRPADALWIAAASVGAGVEDVAAHRGADLVVIGSAHRGPIGRVLAGDDAASVLHHAHRSVALAPHGFRDYPHRLETVGVAYDGSLESRLALHHAAALADELGAELRVRAIAEPYPAAMRVGPGGAYAAAAENLIDRAREQLGTLEQAELEIAVGPTGEALAEFSAELDLLVCGSRHNGALKRVTLGSTSDYLAHHSECPLIVTPAPDER